MEMEKNGSKHAASTEKSEISLETRTIPALSGWFLDILKMEIWKWNSGNFWKVCVQAQNWL
jgi:hypothetical protein